MNNDAATIRSPDTAGTGGTKVYKFESSFIVGISSIIVFLIVSTFIISYFCLCSHRNRRPGVGHNTAKREEAGLDEGTLNMWPMITYAEAKHHDRRANDDDCCSVCLVNYEDEDELRMLPQCGHLFHVQCVDPWLRLQPRCPVCRSSIGASAGSTC